MSRRIRGAAFLVAALATAPLPAVQLSDDRGVVVDLATRPARIIALSPHLAETVYAAGAGPQLTAVVRYSDFPPSAGRLPQVGDASRIDIERIIALKPDLILGWQSGNPTGDLQRLERLGFRLFVTEPKRLSDIARLVRAIGALAGTEAAAETAAASFESDLEVLRARYSSREPIRVFYEIWHRPLLTVNRAHLISDVIALCGGRNVFAAAAVLTPSVSLEAVLAARPQVILGGSSATRPEELSSEWQHAPIAALRGLPVRYVPSDLIQRQTPRIAAGARTVCEHLDDVRRDVSGKR
jgi:iron complex transport system substrate-binding protein